MPTVLVGLRLAANEDALLIPGQKSAFSNEGTWKAVRIVLPAHFRAGAQVAPQLPG